jgi:3-hydroxybutyrate dehydrogenase
MAEVAALGVKVGFHGADMSKPDEIEAMAKRLLLGPLSH